MNAILIDTDVVLNVLLHEAQFCRESAKVFARLKKGDIQGYLTATTITNIYYIAKKRTDRDVARKCIEELLNTAGLDILAVEKRILLDALRNEMDDFEDAVQASVADARHVDYIVTRNVRDFRKSPIPAILPENFLTIYQ